MRRFMGAIRYRSRWGSAELDDWGDRQEIWLGLTSDERSIRAWRVASPEAPRTRSWVRCFPETCFAALQGGRPPAAARGTVVGRKERWALLQTVFPGLPLPPVPRGMSEADAFDVLVLAWAAREVAAGRYTRTPAGDVVPGRFRLVT